MKLKNVLNSVLYLVLALPMSILAQVNTTTGLGQFQLQDAHQYDRINLADLSVAISVPMRNKTGVLPFSMSLIQQFAQIGIPLQGGGGGGGEVNTVLKGQSLTGYPQVGSLGGLGTTNYPCGAMYTRPYITDGFGLTHAFTAANSCPPSGSSPPDGSGYTIVFGANNSDYSIYDLSGNSSTAPQTLSSPPCTQKWQQAYKDTTNNQLTQTTEIVEDSQCLHWLSETTQWVDSMGVSVMSLNYFIVPNNNYSFPQTYTYNDINGNPQSYTLNYIGPLGNYSVCTTVGGGNNTLLYLPNSLTLPDTSSILISYETQQVQGNQTTYTGRPAGITLPSRGSVSFTYSGGPQNNGYNSGDCSTNTIKRTDSDGITTYTHTTSTCLNTPWELVGPSLSPLTEACGGQTTVTTASGSKVVYTFAVVSSQPSAGNANMIYGAVPVEIQTYQNSNPNSLLKTQQICYNGNTTNCGSVSAIVFPIIEKDTYTYLPGKAQPSISQISYDGYGQVTEDREVDFGGTVPTSDTKTVYGTYNNGNCTAIGNYINNHICMTQVKDGAGNVLKQTNNSYDPQRNLLSSSQLVGGTTYLTKSFTYNANGTIHQATDVNGRVTTFTHGACNGILPTSIASGGLSGSITWDTTCAGGVMASFTDANGALTKFAYNDPLWRVTAVTDPLQNITNYTYGLGGTYSETALLFNSGNSVADSRITADSLGRPYIEQIRQGPTSSNYDTATYGYDSNGRVNFASLPCVKQAWGSACGSVGTTYTFDGLSRPTRVADSAQPTPGQVLATYPQNDVLSTLSPAPTGENAKQKQTEYDGLGRLISVCEITSAAGSSSCGQVNTATGFLTRYKYDAVGRLIGVCQHTTQPLSVDCIQTPSAAQQTRTYTYDGMGRLTSETNPETGTTQYVYDTASSTCSSIVSKGDLVERINNSGVHICQSYDAFHRPTRGNAVGGSSAGCFGFQYGDSNPTPPNGVTIQNGSGRLVDAYTDSACSYPTGTITDEWFGYSPRGELTDVYESTPNSGGYYHTSASYWANGALNTLAGVPGLSGWTFTPDGEGRLYSATYGTSTTLVASTTYYPSNPNTTVTFGTGDTDTYGFDLNTGRMNSFQFSVGATPKTLTGTPGWNANGTLGTLGISDQLNASNTQNCSYVYDDLARIQSVNCANGSTNVWSQNFTLDPFGNLSKSGSSSFAASYLLANGTTNNQEQSVGSCVPTYDANGNMTKDCSFSSPYTYAWDAYGNPTQIRAATVIYDALDREVEVSNGSTHTQILYSPVGKLGVMNGQTAKTIRVPLPGGSKAELADATGASKRILHADWLGSSRLSTFLNRTLAHDGAYAPYGEDYATAGTASGEQDFTGAFQDTIAGLYDFLRRKYDPVQGRWISADPSGLAAADPTDPQSWNRYAYVKNDPLSRTDSTGLDDDGDAEDASDAGADDAIEDANGNVDATLIWDARNQSIYTGTPWGWNVTNMDPWAGASLAPLVFGGSNLQLLANTAGAMNTVTAAYGILFTSGAAAAGGSAIGIGSLATGLYHSAVSTYLIYGAPLVSTMACAELCNGMSVSPVVSESLVEAPGASATAITAGEAATTNTALFQKYINGSGGRWGSNATRALNDSVATGLENLGFKVTGGAGRASEEWIKGAGPGLKGGTFVDITAVKGAMTVRVQTVTTLADGVTLTPAEAAAAARIQQAFPMDQLILIPKAKK